jgi:cytidyltransferase-like protein
MEDREILKAVYIEGVRRGKATLSSISEVLGDPEGVGPSVERLVEAGLLDRMRGRLSLTDRGRRRIRTVMIGGAFEIIHPGHLHTISQARRLGDALVVVVATNESVKRNKRREPVTDESARVELVSSLKEVDLAILGGHGSIYETLERVRPDIVAIGYDQRHSAEEITREGKRRGLNVRVVRLRTPIPELKTTRIVNEFR